MSSLKEHMESSMFCIKQKHHKLLLNHREIICQLIMELHVWFDFFNNKKGPDFDYTGFDCIKHREKRHHREGINEAVKIFTAKFGAKFKKIIEEEAEKHVIDDMGKIYDKDDYQQIGFWKQIRGW